MGGAVRTGRYRLPLERIDQASIRLKFKLLTPLLRRQPTFKKRIDQKF